ncbi:MAG: hypothetical protein VX257_07035 [Planctomycetota bacterium]|nr:hypothetical protein [Planctomycetota bacterium]
MKVRLTRALILAAAFSSLGASYRTENFIVTAPTSRLAQRICQHAEQCRRQLAIEWLGRELPRWQAVCPITANVAPHLGAGGATSFSFPGGQPANWQMSIQGSEIRILDSVLPHEVTHTIFATHFGQPLPRWADEGACTTVEHPSEKSRHQKLLIRFLQTDRGISFSRMFAMKEYPADMLPLYAQGFSLARYLIEQGGQRKFVQFVTDGLRDENWTLAIRQNYRFENLLVLQNRWLDWVRQGSPKLEEKTVEDNRPLLADKRPRPAPNLIFRVARDNWRSAGSPPRGSASGGQDGDKPHQAVRQQPLQQPRQRVLE